MFVGYVFGGQQFDGTHFEIDYWLRSEKVERGSWDTTKGCSTINGQQFYNHVNIPDEDDFIAFLLKFAGKVCRAKP